jgi:hypothetical protein
MKSASLSPSDKPHRSHPCLISSQDHLLLAPFLRDEYREARRYHDGREGHECHGKPTSGVRICDFDQSTVCQKILALVRHRAKCSCGWIVSPQNYISIQPLTGVRRYAGYANSVIGSIVANRGFINQYGTVRDPKTGALALNATHIALWGALYFVSAVCIQSVAPTTADRYGRKFNMWGITFFITLVSARSCSPVPCLADTSSPSSSNASPKRGGRFSSLD